LLLPVGEVNKAFFQTLGIPFC